MNIVMYPVISGFWEEGFKIFYCHSGWKRDSYYCSAAKLLQSCLTLRDPIESSPPGSAVHGMQWKWKKKKWKSLSPVQLFAAPWNSPGQNPGVVSAMDEYNSLYPCFVFCPHITADSRIVSLRNPSLSFKVQINYPPLLRGLPWPSGKFITALGDASIFGTDLLLLHILSVSLSLFYPIPFNPPNALLQQFSPFSLSSIVFPSLVNYPFSIHFVKSPLK